MHFSSCWTVPVTFSLFMSVDLHRKAADDSRWECTAFAFFAAVFRSSKCKCESTEMHKLTTFAQGDAPALGTSLELGHES
jgi:hypothetical protein